jgi:excisionase family DNA binding protein
MAGHEDPLLDVNTAADYLGVSERFIRRLVAERRIPYHKLGRFVRIAQSDLDTLLAANRRDAIVR